MLASGGVLLVWLVYGFRTDVGTLQPAKRLPDGRLVAEAHITRPGIFEYKDPSYPGGIRRELRSDEEVYDQASLDSLSNLPITVGHPTKLLTAATAKQHMVGATGDVAERDDDHVKTRLMVADASAIGRMDKAREVSLGYACEVDETPGIHPKYGRYDASQRKIRGNHLAVAVGSARAGREARVRMDDELTDAELASAKKIGSDSAREENVHAGRFDAGNTHGGAMDLEKLKESLRVLESDLKAASDDAKTQKARADSAETDRDVERGRITMLEKEIGTLRATIAAGATASETAAVIRETARADAAEKLVARFDEVRQKEVRERCALMLQGATVMGQDFRMDDLSDREIKVAVIKRLDSTESVANEVTDGEITGKFDMLVKGFKRNARSLASVQTVMADVAATASRADSDSKDQRIREMRDQWKKPLPNDIRARKEA